MIIGIGIDIIETERFANYHQNNGLQRIFAQNEIDYCLQEPSKSAERFAARFAAKEALYKALTQALGHIPCPFLTLCANCAVIKGPAPTLSVDWQALNLKELPVLVTLSHTQKLAISQVILQKI